MSAAGLNTYLYAPKDDLKHRSHWREPYSAEEAARLRELVQRSRQLNLRFIYALSPGLDIRYSNPADGDALKKKFAQLLELGCRDFALLFDDIPDRMDPADRDRWTSFASAQSH
jgi:protein O-GlcNAcase/histone acetyltransferase